MTTITVDVIERDVAGYLSRVRAGESLLVMEGDRPIAEIKPISPDVIKKNRQPRQFGLAAGEFVVPDDFDDPLPADTFGLRPSGLAEGDFIVPDDFDAPLPKEALRSFGGG